MARTLVIGGPCNGQLVEWPVDRPYYAVIEMAPASIFAGDPTGPPTRTTYYHVTKLSLFGYVCPIWLHEGEKLTDPDTVDKLLMELLSFKGANVINSGERQPEHEYPQ